MNRPRIYWLTFWAIKLLLLAAVLAEVAVAPLALLSFFSDLSLLWQIFYPRSAWMCPTVHRFATDAKEVWLTIDDGPDPVDTPQLLRLLDEHGARASFFLIGARAAEQPDLVRAIVAAGHEVGTHSHTHPVGRFWALGPKSTKDEVARGVAALEAVGVRPRWFRSPVGFKSLWLHRELQRHQLRAVAWSIRSCDTRPRGPHRIVAEVLRKVKPGAILLFHEGPSVPPENRVKVVRQVLQGLAECGYRSVIPSNKTLLLD